MDLIEDSERDLLLLDPAFELVDLQVQLFDDLVLVLKNLLLALLLSCQLHGAPSYLLAQFHVLLLHELGEVAGWLLEEVTRGLLREITRRLLAEVTRRRLLLAEGACLLLEIVVLGMSRETPEILRNIIVFLQEL
uniref:Uncharacterized protein n=1 Tax=Strombidium inclinatum TaxID=197538 RepID=A0A7S3IH66_9SPIT